MLPTDPPEGARPRSTDNPDYEGDKDPPWWCPRCDILFGSRPWEEYAACPRCGSIAVAD